MKKKSCNCDWHKEYKFLLSLKKEVNSNQYKKLESYFDDKWMGEEELVVTKEKLNETWPGYKLKKAIHDMFKLGWFDNLTYVELIGKASKQI